MVFQRNSVLLRIWLFIQTIVNVLGALGTVAVVACIFTVGPTLQANASVLTVMLVALLYHGLAMKIIHDFKREIDCG
jgi:hypothetical protein